MWVIGNELKWVYKSTKNECVRSISRQENNVGGGGVKVAGGVMVFGSL